MIDVERDGPLGWFSRFDADTLIPEVENIPENGVYLEVGVHLGRSLWTARQASKPSVEVYGVDIVDDPKIEGTIFLQGDSTTMPFDKEIDVIFIDGDHSYEGCKKDIENWYPRMKKGGVMLFHDCDETSPGVVQAVKEFVEQYKFKDMYYHPEQRCSMARIRL
jgi:predicted O-methyltransferase YrrM